MSPPNRVVSGKTRATSNQPAFIVPNGAALSLVIDGTPTSLVFDVNGTAVTVSSDLTKSSLTAAPSTNNTALVNDTDAADQEDTRLWGEVVHRKSIIIDTVGSEITALVGKFAAFKLDNGSVTEYFYAFVKSATELSNCFRGYFYDSSLAPKNRIVFSNNDTITLMKLGYIFIENDATTVDVTYNAPVWSDSAPSSPATGDYWHDMVNLTWKRYDGASFQIINRTLVGMFVNDTTACVAARCVDFYANHSSENGLRLELQSTEIVRGADSYGATVSFGQKIYFGKTRPSWNITTDLAAAADMYNATEQASTPYYLYLSDEGQEKISDIAPYMRPDLRGAYHPHNPWRCVGLSFNNSSSDLVDPTSFSQPTLDFFMHTGNGHGSSNTNIRRFTTTLTRGGSDVIETDSGTLGTKFTCYWPGKFSFLYTDQSTVGNAVFGMTKNTTSGSTSVTSLAVPEIVALSFVFAGGTEQCLANLELKIGDVITGHTDATPNGTSAAVVNMRVAKLRHLEP